MEVAFLKRINVNFSVRVYTHIEESIVCPFGIRTFASQKKREKLFWECIFGLLKGKLTLLEKENQH